jgi:hypothetical protein
MTRRSETLVVRDVYVRHTDKAGRRHVQVHRCWDAPRFLRALADAAVKVGGKARAEQITEAQYKQARAR